MALHDNDIMHENCHKLHENRTLNRAKPKKINGPEVI